MDETATHVLTRLLDAAGNGDLAAREQLLEAVYGELRQIAAAQMASERPGRTLQPTALVHEAWLRLMAGNGNPAGPGATFANRRHFFAAAANAMRRIRIDDARSRNRLKRGGPGLHRSTTGAIGHGDHWTQSGATDPVDDLALDEALTKLEHERPDLAEVVKLRYFAGLNIDQTAELLGVTSRTVDNRWQLAKAWLKRALE